MKTITTSRLIALPLAAILSLFLIGCATEVVREPVQFRSAGAEKESPITITRDVSVTLSTGYARTLRAGSIWKYVGRVPQGMVYAIQDDVFMLEGKHMHEAHSVIASGSTLVGFYLPVEQAFAPLAPSVVLPLKQ